MPSRFNIFRCQFYECYLVVIGLKDIHKICETSLKGKAMKESRNLIVLDQTLILTKEGKNDLVFENDTLLKVKMISNHHIVVEDDQQISFVLKQQDENVIWSFV